MTNYLAEYDATPDAGKWKLARTWIDSWIDGDDALPFFQQLRQQRPVVVVPTGVAPAPGTPDVPKCVLLANYDDIIEAFNMPDVFTVQLYWPKMNDGIYLMAHDDDALHYREKSIMQGLLNRDDVPKVRAMVGKIANRLLDGAKGNMEAINGYFRLVPATLVREYFGLTGAGVKKLMEWSYWNQTDLFYNQPFDFIEPPWTSAEITKRHDKANQELALMVAIMSATHLITVPLTAPWRWIKLLWHSLRVRFGSKTAPLEMTDNIFNRMMRSGYPLEVCFNIVRLGINASGLLIGTIETTQQATSQVVQFLLRKPDLMAKAKTLAQAADPSAFDSLVYEALRYVPISPYMFRQTSRDVTVGLGTDHATKIPKGTNVLLLTQSAMFDPRAYADPDTFDPNRPWYNNFTFGYGIHECLGKWVGMVMIPEMVRQIILRPGLRQANPDPIKGGIQYEIHLPKSYHLQWDK